jgi:hypothetical protein
VATLKGAVAWVVSGDVQEACHRRLGNLGVHPAALGERTFVAADQANFYGRDRMFGDGLRQTRCSGAYAGRWGPAS